MNFLGPLEDPHVVAIAKRAGLASRLVVEFTSDSCKPTGRSAAAVLARWALQLGLAVASKHAETEDGDGPGHRCKARECWESIAGDSH